MWKMPDEDEEHKNKNTTNKRLQKLAECFSLLMSQSLSDGLPSENIVYEVRLLKYELLKPISWHSYTSKRQEEDKEFKIRSLYDPEEYFSKN